VRLRDHERPLLVHEVARTHTPRYRTVDPIPLTLKVGLNLLQTVQGTHFLWGTFRLLLLLLLVGARGGGTVWLLLLLLLLRGGCERRVVHR
jgi:hypothetical protein